MESALDSLVSFAQYSLGFCLRYFALAGGLYWILHHGYRQVWLPYRVQSSFPGREQIRYEIRWSLINAACSGISTALTVYLVQSGRTSMYFSIDERGWPWFVFTIALCLFGYDTWIYWQHRAMHTSWLYRNIHYVHHRVGNPTPFATFAQHPIETFIGNLFFILVILYVPMHMLALSLAGAYMFAYGILGHLGYEFFPRWVTSHPLLRYLQTATYHNIHHSEQRCNYAAWFLFWDRAMGTAHASYEPALNAIDARVRNARRLAQGLEASPESERVAA